MSAERFADQLRRHRLAAGMTQEDLAERSGLSVRGISDLERGLKQRPHPETVRMLAAALDLQAEALAAFRDTAAPAPRSPLAPAAMPEPLTSLIGREDEVRAVAAHLGPDTGIRLVTLTGPGGVGKTRLAIQVAGEVRDQFVDGVAFVPLAGLTDPRLVLAATATALGVRELAGRAPLDLLSRQLQDRQVLVVVDNCEHLLAAAPDVAALLGACRGITILATSRAPLRITGEHEYPVRPLALPDPARTALAGDLMASPAVTLFVRQARAIRPTFDVTDANGSAVAAICARVDGLPLALELAAVRMKTLAPGELDALLANRLGVLTGGPRDQPERHQTLRSTIAWSHDLLPPEEQTTFRRFAVFATGATLESTAAIVADGERLRALDHLTALMDQSLVQRYEGSWDQPRFVMLETIREYALEQLAASDEEQRMLDRHAAHFLEMAEQGETALAGPEQAVWMRRLEADYGNLRAALGWAIGCGDAAASQRFGSALWRFWAASGRLREAQEWLDRALALTPDDVSAVRARALLRRGNIAVDLADYPTARDMYQASLSIYQALADEVNACLALGGLGLVHFSEGEYDYARAAQESILRTWQSLGRDLEVARALQNLGNIAIALGDFADARGFFDSALAIRRQLGDPGSAAHTTFSLGLLDRLEGNSDEARHRLAGALAEYNAVDDRLGIAFVLNELGSLAHDLGDNNVAIVYHLDALSERREAGDIQGTVDCLEGIAAVAIAQGQVRLGVQFFATAAAWRRRHGAPLLPSIKHLQKRGLDQARSELSPATFERAWGDGETATLDDALDLAYVLFA